MELLGRAQVEIRDAPDARVVLEIALVRLVRPELDETPERSSNVWPVSTLCPVVVHDVGAASSSGSSAPGPTKHDPSEHQHRPGEGSAVERSASARFELGGGSAGGSDGTRAPEIPTLAGRRRCGGASLPGPGHRRRGLGRSHPAWPARPGQGVLQRGAVRRGGPGGGLLRPPQRRPSRPLRGRSPAARDRALRVLPPTGGHSPRGRGSDGRPGYRSPSRRKKPTPRRAWRSIQDDLSAQVEAESEAQARLLDAFPGAQGAAE